MEDLKQPTANNDAADVKNENEVCVVAGKDERSFLKIDGSQVDITIAESGEIGPGSGN